MINREVIFTSFLVLSMVILLARTSFAFDIVSRGKAQTSIVVPDDSTKITDYAAQEMQYHIEQSTGVKLPITKECDASGRNLIYLGNCRQTLKQGISADKLAVNGFIIKLVGDNLYICGDDSKDGDPLPIGKTLQGDWTRMGTVFGVYEFLEKQLKVKWLWPGKTGEVVPRFKEISVSKWDQTEAPLLVHSRFRDATAKGNYEAWSSPEAADKYFFDQTVWLRRQRFATGVNMDISHSFSKYHYWDRFNESHPEYFNLLTDGTRSADVTYKNGRTDLIAMCVSQPALWNQIIEDWKSRDPHHREKYLGIGENDTQGKCVCKDCLAMDVPDPASTVPFAERVDAARKAYQARDPKWFEPLGSLSDRYARYFKAVLAEAQKVDPDVSVMGYAYANYAKPPISTKLNDHIVVGIVPSYIYPWTEKNRKAFREQWLGWSSTGAKLMLRPNYMLAGNNMPLNYARKLGEDLTFAAKNGMIATDFDSLTGQWSTQGLNLYVLARLTNHPDLTVDKVLDDYYEGFGPAKNAVKAYFEHWEKIDNSITEESYKQKSELYEGNWMIFYRMADSIFTPDAMAEGRELLMKAKEAAGNDSDASAKIKFLEEGLKNAELTMAVQEAFRKYKGDGDVASYRLALDRLDAYRKSVDSHDIANMSILRKWETITWNRDAIKSIKLPGVALNENWKFAWDPKNIGETEGWFKGGFNSGSWDWIQVDKPYEKQDAGRRWKASHGQDYQGICWYRNEFGLKATGSSKVRLIFGSVDESCRIWLNGQLIADRPYPYKGNSRSWQEAFEVDITKYLNDNGPNILAVRVENNTGDGGIYKPVWLDKYDEPIGQSANLIVNPGFENDTTNWSSSKMVGDIVFSVDTNECHSQKKSARITCNALSSEKGKAGAYTSWGRMYQKDIPVEPGAIYQLRLWVKTSPSFSGDVRIWFSQGSTTSSILRSTNGIWREVVMDDIKSTSDKATIYLNLANGLGDVWFDDIHLLKK